MAGKYSTWTKGERRHAVQWLSANDILSTPQRYSDVEGPRVAKSLPYPDDDFATLESGNTVDVIDHKAATTKHSRGRSTSSWLVARKDLLGGRVPQARSSVQSSTLQVPTTRTRSHTAPSTPFCSHPPEGIAELPGSDPVAFRYYSPGAIRAQPLSAAWTTSHDAPGVSPWSSPRPEVAAGHCDMISGQTCKPTRGSLPAITTQHRVRTLSSLGRLRLDSGTSYTAQPFVNASSPLHLSPMHNFRSAYGTETPTPQGDIEAMLMQQIALLRATHDRHLASLKDAHDKELTSHLSYIAFLEQRSSAVPSLTSFGLNHHPLQIDTTRPVALLCELPGLDMSATTESSSSLTFPQTRHDSIKEIESLKRLLSSAQKQQVDTKRESQQLEEARDALGQRNRRVLQLKEALRLAHENEKVLRSTIDGLEAQLVSSNNERLDVLEGFHDACQQLEKTLAERKTPSGTPQPGCVQAGSAVVTPTNSVNPRVLALQAENDLLRRALQDKEKTIETLHTRQRARQNSEVHNSARFFELQSKLDMQEATLRKAEEDRDQLNSLLHSELRKQTRRNAQQARTSTPSDHKQVSVRLQGMLAHSQFAANDTASSEQTSLQDLLEKQLESCLREVISQKLEICSLKKDLHNAQGDLSALQAMTSPRPPTPKSGPSSPPTSRSTSISRARTRTPGSESDGGLGITLSGSPSPKSTSRRLGTVKMEAIFHASPPALIDIKPISPPQRQQSRSKTPLGSQKRLPKPPIEDSPRHETAGMSPVVRLQRAETHRSLSDSIISSYAQRATPEQPAFNEGMAVHGNGEAALV